MSGCLSVCVHVPWLRVCMPDHACLRAPVHAHASAYPSACLPARLSSAVHLGASCLCMHVCLAVSHCVCCLPASSRLGACLFFRGVCLPVYCQNQTAAPSSSHSCIEPLTIPPECPCLPLCLPTRLSVVPPVCQAPCLCILRTSQTYCPPFCVCASLPVCPTGLGHLQLIIISSYHHIIIRINHGHLVSNVFLVHSRLRP